jgi:hypothetical protein
MPYGVVLKDERRTSNIERPTSNEKTNIEYRTFNGYFFFFSAVLILVTKILINSHPKTAVFGLEPSAISFQRNTHKSNPARAGLTADN